MKPFIETLTTEGEPNIINQIIDNQKVEKMAQEKLSASNQELLKLMNGCEVHSLNYEGCIYIRGNKVIREGVTIATLNTNTKVKELWKEYVRGEGF